MSPDDIINEDVASILTSCKHEMDGLSGKRLLLTGGSGFIGSYVVEAIIAFNRKHPERACELHLPTRDLSNLARLRPHMVGLEHIHWFEWDPLSPLEPPIDACDHIIHGAASTDHAKYLHDPDKMKEQMMTTTGHIVDYARKKKVSSFLYISSGAVYGTQPPDLFAVGEGAVTDPSSLKTIPSYGLGKLGSEKLCLSSGLPVTIARLFAFIGPYQDLSAPHAVPDFIRQSTTNGKIVINGDGTPVRGYCYSSDLTVILFKLLLLEKKKHSVYNVGSSRFLISMAELARSIADIIGDVKVEIRTKKGASDVVPSRYVPDTTRLDDIHVPTIDIGTGLMRTIGSMRSRGLIPERRKERKNE